MKTRKARKTRKSWLIVPLILLVAFAGYFLFTKDEIPDLVTVANLEPVPQSTPPQPTQAPPTEPEPPQALNPIEPLPLEMPLPELSMSDEPFHLALGNITGKTGLAPVLSEKLISHIVATVDNLPRKHLPASIVPLKRAEGVFVVDGNNDSFVISSGNNKRYSLHTAAAKVIDSASLVDLYRRYYPLFQNAYQELGYPQAHFNDRLVVAIDDLLAAPELPSPVRLNQPKVLYEYADPKLEGRSAGQKIMMRIGKENASALKKKLADIRALIATRPPERETAPEDSGTGGVDSGV